METINNINNLLNTVDKQLKSEEGLKFTVIDLETIAYLSVGALLVGIILIVISKKLIK